MLRRQIDSFFQRVLQILNGNLKTINGQSVVGSGNITVGGGGANWGGITGTLSAQTDLQTALNNKQDTLVSGTNLKSLNSNTLLGSGNLTIDKTFVGLSNVDNTSDLNKPISTATQTALNAKQDSLILTTTGTSGAATLIGSTLNIPQYSGGGGGGAVTTIGIGTTGINVTGTTSNTITQSILIPANTLASNNALDIVARFRKTGTAGSSLYRIYINSSNSLTGATLISNLYTIASGATILSHQNQRTFFYDGTTLTTNSSTGSNITDIIQLTSSTFSFVLNSTIDYYLIFAIQLNNSTDSSAINGYRVLKYA